MCRKLEDSEVWACNRHSKQSPIVSIPFHCMAFPLIRGAPVRAVWCIFYRFASNGANFGDSNDKTDTDGNGSIFERHVEKMNVEFVHLKSRNMLTNAEHIKLADILSVLRVEYNHLNDEYSKTIDQLSNELLLNKQEIGVVKADSRFMRYIICLQDLNSEYRLEANLFHLRKDLRGLRSKRNGSSHLYRKTDSKDVINYKTDKALQMLLTMDPACSAKFRIAFSCQSLVADVVKYLKNHDLEHLNVKPEEKSAADDFWEGVDIGNGDNTLDVAGANEATQPAPGRASGATATSALVTKLTPNSTSSSVGGSKIPSKRKTVK